MLCLCLPPVFGCAEGRAKKKSENIEWFPPMPGIHISTCTDFSYISSYLHGWDTCKSEEEDELSQLYVK